MFLNLILQMYNQIQRYITLNADLTEQVSELKEALNRKEAELKKLQDAVQSGDSVNIDSVLGKVKIMK